jgi:hypothetical protein
MMRTGFTLRPARCVACSRLASPRLPRGVVGQCVGRGRLQLPVSRVPQLRHLLAPVALARALHGCEREARVQRRAPAAAAVQRARGGQGRQVHAPRAAGEESRNARRALRRAGSARVAAGR